MALTMTTGTTVTFGGNVGDTVAMSNESIASAAGRQSAVHDLGDPASGNTPFYLIEAIAQTQATTPVLGQEIVFYIKEKVGNDAQLTNDDGTGDVAVSAIDKLRNLRRLGSIKIDQVAADIPLGARLGVFEINVQNIHMVMWNASGATTTADDAETKVYLTPVTYSDV